MGFTIPPGKKQSSSSSRGHTTVGRDGCQQRRNGKVSKSRCQLSHHNHQYQHQQPAAAAAPVEKCLYHNGRASTNTPIMYCICNTTLLIHIHSLVLLLLLPLPVSQASQPASHGLKPASIKINRLTLRETSVRLVVVSLSLYVHRRSIFSLFPFRTLFFRCWVRSFSALQWQQQQHQR